MLRNVLKYTCMTVMVIAAYFVVAWWWFNSEMLFR